MLDDAVDTPPDEVGPVDTAGFETTRLLDWLEQMIFIRSYEQALDEIALRGKILGSVHVAAGQEAVAVGVVQALRPSDPVTSGHRPHHHALAKGLDPNEIMAELYGRATGCAAGRGGTMHLVDFDRAYLGGNGIVGAGLGIAMGAALAEKHRRTGGVAVGFFGDGGANTGRVWESINLAAVWKLPLVAVCENNLYAVETDFWSTFAGESIAARAAGFGLPSIQVDGQDVCAVHRAAYEAVDRARAGGGPTFIEALTYRYHGHVSGEITGYRSAEEIERWRTLRDPIARLATALHASAALTDAEVVRMEETAAARVREAVEFAENSPWPDPATATLGVLSPALTGNGHDE